VIPKGLRDKWNPFSRPATKKPANPATYFIWIYILIGSQAIRIMGIQTEYTTFMRKADLKLRRLREVVEKIQKGEEVDVEKVLGTGDETQEQEWEEAMKELEEEDRVWARNKQKSLEEEERSARETQDASPVNESVDKTNSTPIHRPGFY
jgi:hypothetical protein